MPRPRFQKLPESKRAAILEAARGEFAARGLDGASLNMILAAVGLSKGAFYYYFDDKDDLFATVVEASMDEMVQAVGELPAPESLTAETFWDRLTALSFASGRFAAANPWAVGLLKAAYDVPRERWASLFGPALGALGTWYADVLRRGMALGVVRTDLPLSVLVNVSVAAGVALDRSWIEAAERGESWDLDAWAHQGVDLMRRFLAPLDPALDAPPPDDVRTDPPPTAPEPEDHAENDPLAQEETP